MNARVRVLAATVATGLTLALAACGGGTTATGTADPAVTKKADAALAELSKSVLSKGPHGETAAAADTITLTPDEQAKVKAMNASAAIVLHYGGNDWSQAQVEGLKNEFGALGINIQAVTDANFKPDKQVSDLETVMSRKPNVIVSIPTDPVATAAEYKKVADAGTKLVFMDNAPQGLVAGKDYTQRRLGRQLRQRRGLRPPHGRGARGQGQDRRDLPRGRFLRHPAALRRLHAPP